MPPDMLPHILAYFRAEKAVGPYVLAVGVIFLIIGIAFWWCGPRLRGIGISLAAIAMMQVFVGSSLYFGSDKQIDTLTEQYYTNRDNFEKSETARMDSVMLGLAIFKKVEIALIALGVVLAIVSRKRALFSGIGMGLVVQAAIMLWFETAAIQRAAIYVDAISRMSS